MFFQYNSALGPPYHVLVDTNFINFSIQNKLELIKSMMDCLYAKCECKRLKRLSGKRPLTIHISHSVHNGLCVSRIGEARTQVSHRSQVSGVYTTGILGTLLSGVQDRSRPTVRAASVFTQGYLRR